MSTVFGLDELGVFARMGGPYTYGPRAHCTRVRVEGVSGGVASKFWRAARATPPHSQFASDAYVQ